MVKTESTKLPKRKCDRLDANRGLWQAEKRKARSAGKERAGGSKMRMNGTEGL